MPEDLYIFPHECEEPGCDIIVQYDDEPKCFTHSPDEGSSVPDYSARYVAEGREIGALPPKERADVVEF